MDVQSSTIVFMYLFNGLPCCRHTSAIKGLIHSRGLHVPAVVLYDTIGNYTVTL